jgi:hypothetical protein
MFDWRALRRWGLKEAIYRPAYRRYLVGGISLDPKQAGLSTGCQNLEERSELALKRHLIPRGHDGREGLSILLGGGSRQSC